MRRKLAVILLGVVLLTGCGMSKEEKEFVDAVEDSIVKKYEEIGEIEIGEPITRANSYEIMNMTKYKEKQFKDEEFDRVAKDYIRSIEISEDARKENDEMTALTIQKESTELRYNSLNELKGKYGLELPDKVQKSVDRWLDETDDIVVAYREIEESIDNSDIRVDGNSVYVDVENVSRLNSSGGYIKAKTYDKNGYEVDEDVSIVGDFPTGYKEEVMFLFSEDFETVEISDMYFIWKRVGN